MKALFAEIVHVRWLFVIAWRIVNGRWFIFRDVPAFVVKRWADDCRESTNADLARAGREAEDELALRASRCNKV